MVKTSTLTVILAVMVLSVVVFADEADGAGLVKRAISTAGKWLHSDLPVKTVFTNASNTYDDGKVQTFTDDDIRIQDNTGGQFYTFSTGDLVADRSISLPVLGATDVFVFEGATQTLTGKTINGGANTFSAIPESSITYTVVTKTGSYTITTSDYIVIGDTTSGAFTLTLPTAVGIDGQIFKIKKKNITENTLTVDGSGSETIDGQLTYLLRTQYQSITVQSDGANWLIIDNYAQQPYAQISDASNQNCPVSTAAQNVTLNTNDVITGLIHSTSSNTNEIIAVEPGIYQFIAGAQVGRTSSTGADTHNLWMMKNNVKISGTNVKTYMPAVLAQTSVVFINWIGQLTAGDKISYQQSCTLSTGVTGLKFTAAGIPPSTPSIIITVFKLSD